MIRTESRFLEKYNETGKNVDIKVSDFSGMTKPLNCYCRTCKHNWFISQARYTLKKSFCCPECLKKRLSENYRLSEKEFFTRVEKHHKDKYIYPENIEWENSGAMKDSSIFYFGNQPERFKKVFQEVHDIGVVKF